jgi:hypothetical protein
MRQASKHAAFVIACVVAAALALAAGPSAVRAQVRSIPDAEIVTGAGAPAQRVAAYERLLGARTPEAAAARARPEVHRAAVEAYIAANRGKNAVDPVPAARAAAERGLALLARAPPRARADYSLALAAIARRAPSASDDVALREELWAIELYAQAARLYREAGDAPRQARALLEQGMTVVSGRMSQPFISETPPADSIRRGRALVMQAIALAPQDKAFAFQAYEKLTESSVALATESFRDLFSTVADDCRAALDIATTSGLTPANGPRYLNNCASFWELDYRPAATANLRDKSAILTRLLNSSAYALSEDDRARLKAVRGTFRARLGDVTGADADFVAALQRPAALDRELSETGTGRFASVVRSARVTALNRAVLKLRSGDVAGGLPLYDQALSPGSATTRWAALPSTIDAVVALASSPIGFDVFVFTPNGAPIARASDVDATSAAVVFEGMAPNIPGRTKNAPMADLKFGFAMRYWYERDMFRGAAGGDLVAAVGEMRQRAGAYFGPTLQKALAEARLRPGARIVIVTPGLLSAMPIAAMANPATGRPFAADYTISFSPSFFALFRSANGFPQGTAPRAIAGLGPPAGSSELPFAAAEYDMIRPQFERGALVARSAAADSTSVLAAMGGAPYWHIATHGAFSLDTISRGDTRLAGLALDRGAILSLQTLERYRAPAAIRLVTLSACESASAVFSVDPLTVRSMPAAFLNAGARGVVAAGWDVTDASTALLMVRFYDSHLRGGEEPARALRTAQTWMASSTTADIRAYVDALVRARRLPASAGALFAADLAADPPASRPFADPYFWAGFTMHGL